MKTYCLFRYYRNLIKNVHTNSIRRYCSSKGIGSKSKIENIRNIGILAHIDAGKTTTTERMLFYSGTIKSMGEVHHGNTVTDFMDQERQRGITITSAAASFPWRDCQINLIDTPGHIDFTMEVEQSLAVLDGAVVVLDGSAGVEAQTLTVWHQAAGYKVPRLIYLNKMDRTDADEQMCVKSIEDRLHVLPLLLHLPVRYQDKFIGLIDLITLEEVIWTQGRGRNFTRKKLTEQDRQYEAAMKERQTIVDKLTGLDDSLADLVISKDSLDDVSDYDIVEAIRRCTIERKAFPVLCGSSYKNIGVQTLMDGIIEYLPSPLHCQPLYKSFGKDLSARVFKVQHHDQKGVLTFLRLYGGDVEKGQKIFNLGKNKSEQSGILYEALADEYKPVQKVTAGNIAVVSGLKETTSGDLITSSQSAANRAKSRLTSIIVDKNKVSDVALPSAKQRLANMEMEPSDQEIVDILLGIGTQIPEPVFLCSIEPPSAAFLPPLEEALKELSREDPSLRVSYDEDSAQLILAGMGELHIDIIKERIISEYKIDVELGPLQIAYREALNGLGRHRLVIDRKIGSVKQNVVIEMSAKHVKGVTEDKVLKFDKTADSAANLAHLHQRQINAISQGVLSALNHGPKLGCKLVDVQVTLHWLEVGRGTSDSVLTASAVQCLRKVFASTECILLEPIMSLQVVCPESHSARVITDITRRRAEIKDIHIRHGNKIIECQVPLAELLGYSSTLRSLSSGLASFTMQFLSYKDMAPEDERKALDRITGF